MSALIIIKLLILFHWRGKKRGKGSGSRKGWLGGERASLDAGVLHSACTTHHFPGVHTTRLGASGTSGFPTCNAPLLLLHQPGFYAFVTRLRSLEQSHLRKTCPIPQVRRSGAPWRPSSALALVLYLCSYRGVMECTCSSSP